MVGELSGTDRIMKELVVLIYLRELFDTECVYSLLYRQKSNYDEVRYLYLTLYL